LIQRVKVYEQTQEALALLKILDLNRKNLERKNFKTLGNTFKEVSKSIDEFIRNRNEI
jgi:hypothetical protein